MIKYLYGQLRLSHAERVQSLQEFLPKANQKDLDLIFELSDYAVKSAIKGISGVVGWDEENNNTLDCIEFNSIKGGKPFDINQNWYTKMKKEIRKIEK